MHDHHDHHQHHPKWLAAAHATLHCSIGCILGETLGLMLGTSLSLSQITSMIVSTCLAYAAGFSLAVFPLMRRTGMDFAGALSAIWIGEAISIGVMELVMNAIDYDGRHAYRFHRQPALLAGAGGGDGCGFPGRVAGQCLADRAAIAPASLRFAAPAQCWAPADAVLRVVRT
jgi:Domain of unknown function (DUF4396)